MNHTESVMLARVTAFAELLGANVIQTMSNCAREGYRLEFRADPALQVFVNVETKSQKAEISPIYPRSHAGDQVYGFTNEENVVLCKVGRVGLSLSKPAATVASDIEKRLLSDLRPALSIMVAKIERDRAADEALRAQALEFETFISGSAEAAAERLERHRKGNYSLDFQHSSSKGFSYTITPKGVTSIEISKTLSPDQAKQLFNLLQSFN